MVYSSPSKALSFRVKSSCSILSLCFAAVALITVGIGIISVRFPFYTGVIRVSILAGILDKPPKLTTANASDLSLHRSTALNASSNSSSDAEHEQRRIADNGHDNRPSQTNIQQKSDRQHKSLHSSGKDFIRQKSERQHESLHSSGEDFIHQKSERQHESLNLHSSGQCDLFRGQWGPDDDDGGETMYRNDTCPILTQTQNCQGNGRPDKGYEKWRWRPHGCELPRFDVQTFFRLMQGKTIGFVGDSVARNQMESLMCMLWQAEVPVNRGSRKMQRWYFRSHSVTVIRIWSAWLVNTTSDAFEYAPANLNKLHLEEADDNFMQFLPKLDVLVVSSGHWFTKRTAYILSGGLVGGQLWAHKRLHKHMQNPDAFAITMRTAMRAITSHPHYKGLTILRTYSPDHYEGGAWNTGGSCTGKTRPFTDEEVVSNTYTELMRRHQLQAFTSVQHNITNGSKLRLLDITPVFAYRADGHPGPYRNSDPNKVTQRGPKGQPPPQDCLHWCMPGPIDTWNELSLEIMRQELSS